MVALQILGGTSTQVRSVGLLKEPLAKGGCANSWDLEGFLMTRTEGTRQLPRRDKRYGRQPSKCPKARVVSFLLFSTPNRQEFISLLDHITNLFSVMKLKQG